MIVLLLLLMAYELVGEAAHEWIGISMVLLFILHHILNLAWLKNLTKGRYTGVRILGTVINVLLAIIMLSLMVSGIMMSRHVFAFLSIDSGRYLARILHMATSYWGFALMSVHLGLHWNTLMSAAQKATHTVKASVVRIIILRTAAAFIAAYGIYAFIRRHIGAYMFLQSQFVFFDFDEPLLFFFANYIAVLILFVCIGHFTSCLFMRLLSRKLIKR